MPHAIAHGDDITGATTFRLVAELDAGPVYGVVTEPIGEQDTAGDLLGPAGRIRRWPAGGHARRHRGGAAGTPAAAGRGDQLRPQADPRRRAGALERPAQAVGRQIRACTPAPGAWTMLGDTRLKLWPVRPCPPPDAGSAARRRSRVPRTRGAVGRPCGCVRRDRHPPGRAGRRAAARQAADGRRRMGPRAAPGPGRGRPAAPGLQLTVARGPAAGRGRSQAGRVRRDQAPGARADEGRHVPRRYPRGPASGPARARRGSRGGTGGGGGASGRRTDPARLVAFEVLRAVRERDAYANLLLPALLRERGLTGRDAALATELSLRHAARAGHLRRGDRRLQRPRPRPDRPAACATCSGSARTSCSPPGSARTRRSPRRWTWPGRSPGRARRASSTPCCAGSPPGTWRPGSTPPRPAAAADPLGHLASATATRAWIVAAFAHRSARTRRPWPGRDRGRAGRGQRPAPGDPVRGPRPGHARQNSWPAGRSPRAGPRSARIWRDGDPAAVAAVAEGRAGGAGRGQPAGRARADPGDAGRPGPALARPVRRAGRQGPAACRAGARARGARLLAADARLHRAQAGPPATARSRRGRA